MAEEVRNIEEILLPKYVGENRKIIGCETKRLTEAGENYGSLMLALDVKLANTEDGNENVLHVVAKAVPNNEFLRKMFKSHISFKKELEFYKTIVPTLKEFAQEVGIGNLVDFLPEFYGGRLGKGPNYDTFDEDAVILLENLKTSGFACEDRTKGFDLETAKLILKKMSTLHAIPIALKQKKPDVFQEKFLPYLDHIKVFEEFNDVEMEDMVENIVKLCEECPQCVPYLKNLKEAMFFAFKWYLDPSPPREPFATLTHCDFWINNVMVNKDNNRSISIKIVDFQFIEYRSPVRDIILFIFNSIQNNVVVEYYDDLLETYHQNFVNILSKFDVDTRPFLLDKLKEEIKLGIKEFVVSQCIFMVKATCADKDTVKSIDDVSGEDFMPKYEVPQRHKEKLWMIIEQFGKRGWI